MRTKTVRARPWKPTICNLDFIGSVSKRDDNVFLACRFSFDGCDEYEATRGVKRGLDWVAEGREGVVRDRSEVNRDVWFVYATKEERNEQSFK